MTPLSDHQLSLNFSSCPHTFSELHPKPPGPSQVHRLSFIPTASASIQASDNWYTPSLKVLSLESQHWNLSVPTQRVPFIFIFSAPAHCTPLQQLHATWLISFWKLSCLLLLCLLLLWHLSGTYFFSLVYRNMCVKPKTLCLIEESILWPAWINLSRISYPLNISGSSVDFHDCVYYYLLLTVYALTIRWAAVWGQNQYSFFFF